MNKEEIKEFYQIIEEHCQKKGYTQSRALGFLIAILVECMEITGYSQEVMDEIAEKMKENFKTMRQEKGSL